MARVRGSITVFLTLTMVCVLSLVGTMLDLARYEMASHVAYDALVTAVDSELTNYCKEIYEDYKIFLLEKDVSEEGMSGDQYIESICDFLTYSFEPKREVNIKDINIPLASTDFLSMKLTECTLKGQTMITDQEGEIFQSQVEEYMKYHVPGEIAERLLAKLNLLQNTKTTMSVFREKMEVEEEAATISEAIYDLITEVEGLTFDDGELDMTKDNYIAIQSSFAKQFCTEKVGPKTVAINHNLVWDSLRKEYTNPLTVLKAIQKDNKELITLNKECDTLETKIAKEKNATVREQLEGELEQKEEKVQELEDTISDTGITLTDQAEDIEEHINNAIDIIDGLKGKKESCQSKLGEFETYLQGKKSKLDEGSYNAVSDELTDLKDYLYHVDESGVDTSIVGNVMAMKDCLANNLKAVEKTADLAPLLDETQDPDLEDRQKKVDEAIKEYQSYTLKPLQFDYTNLKTEEKEDSPVGSLGSLVENGICDLILSNASELSKQELNANRLPSNSAIQDSNESDGEELSGDLADQISDGDSDGGDMTSSMEEYESICEDAETQGSAVNDIARRVLLNAYGMSYFKNYATDAKLKQPNNSLEEVLSKDSVMKYEQEYLVMGGETDADNVKDVISRTVFIRTAMNYLSLLTDSGARNKAFVTATAMVGFTGCAPLVTVLKHIILMGWGFEEALVDVGGLMQGKAVPLFKKASNFSVKYVELVTISKAMIQGKVKQLSDDNGILSLTYEDYLNFYMFMVGPDTLSYRMMDLVQENTRLRYKDDFLMSQGVFGLEVSMEYEIPTKFIRIPLISSLIGNDHKFNSVQLSTEYSY